MTNDDMLVFLTNEALKIMECTFSNDEIEKAFEIQLQKTHAMPIRHRVLGGLYQSVNIKFGNFLEILMKQIIDDNPSYTLVKRITTGMPVTDEKFIEKDKKFKDFPMTNTVEGGKSTNFIISKRNQRLIDDYITECTKSDAKKEDIKVNFDKLVKKITENIIEEKKNPLVYDYLTFKNDVDLLFFKNDNNNYFYIELKKEDNHDSGKTKDMYLKVIKTFTCLLYQAYSNDDETLIVESLTPILLFFGDINNPSNILPEDFVFSGEKFFEKYLTIDFSQINDNMCKVSNSQKLIEFLDNKILEILAYPNEKLLNILDKIINENIEKNEEIKRNKKELEDYVNISNKIKIFNETFKKKDAKILLTQIKKNNSLSTQYEALDKILNDVIILGATNKDFDDFQNFIDKQIIETENRIKCKQEELKNIFEKKFSKNIIKNNINSN